jgi:NADPH-dependent glutamate synthase beta subunit-like oxidoreductase
VIERAGVEIRLNSPVASVDQLLREGFRTVFIGTGAHQPQSMPIPGIDLKGVTAGIDFLRAVNLGEKIKIGSDVVVVGGGSTAMDAARVAKRLGARNVRIVYRRTRAEMPALPEEVIEAEEEGIEMDFLVNPLEIIGKSGKVVGVRCIKTRLGDFDDSGRRRPIPMAGSEYTIRTDSIITCLGQKLSLGLTGGKLSLDRRGHIAVDPNTMETTTPGIFAGGDAVNPSTVIESVAQGRRAAVAIDRYLGYDGKLFAGERKPVEVGYDEDAYLKSLPRKSPRHEDIEKRIRSLVVEVNRGLTLEDAIEDARRCLHCDRNQPVIEVSQTTESVPIENML